MNRSLRERMNGGRFLFRGVGGKARDGFRKSRGMIEQFSASVAVADGKQPLVLDDITKKSVDFCPFSPLQKIHKRLLQGIGDQMRADVQVPDEPLQGQLVHEGHRRVGHQDQGDRQWKDEAQRQAQGTE